MHSLASHSDRCLITKSISLSFSEEELNFSLNCAFHWYFLLPIITGIFEQCGECRDVLCFLSIPPSCFSFLMIPVIDGQSSVLNYLILLTSFVIKLIKSLVYRDLTLITNHSTDNCILMIFPNMFVKVEVNFFPLDFFFFRYGRMLPLKYFSLCLLHGVAWLLCLPITNSTITATGKWNNFHKISDNGD